jgi:hypothetical protein
MVKQFLVGVFRGSQDEVVAFENINEAGVAFNHFQGELQNTIQSLMQVIGAGDVTNCLVQDIYVRIVNRNRRRGHEATLETEAHSVQLQFLMATIKQKRRLVDLILRGVQITWVTPLVTLNVHVVAVCGPIGRRHGSRNPLQMCNLKKW